RCDTEARAHAAELRRHALDDLAGIIVSGLREQQRELVATDPERFVAPAQRRMQRARECLKSFVPRRVTETVVQLLEVVEIADDEPERAPVSQGARNFALEPRNERATIQEARQWIVIRKEPQLAQMCGGDDRRGRL